jgi:hypothetical protein
MPRIVGLFLLMITMSVGWALAADDPANLVCPCHLAFLDMFEDGGTVGGELHDAMDRVLRFCLDGGVSLLDSARPAAARDSLAVLRPFYVGAPHPSNPAARALEVGGDEEAALLRLLRSCVDSAIPAEEQEAVFSEYGKAVTCTEQDAFVAGRRLTAEQGLALRVNRLITARAALNARRAP